MFNDLNQDEKNSNSSNDGQKVDDIFAETDKAPEEGNKESQGVNITPSPTSSSAEKISSSGEISTHKVGLASGERINEDNSEGKDNKVFKWVLIAIVFTILLLSAYLIYNKFFKQKANISKIDSKTTNLTTKNLSNNKKVSSSSKTIKKPIEKSVNAGVGSLVPTNSSLGQASSSPASSVNNSETALSPNNSKATSTSVINPKMSNTPPAKFIDTDGDGLTNYDEINIYHTNPNKADTDGDGLSDYEEVMIYHTNPNKADTDGDGYSDGQEVKAGYNPLGPGKLVLSGKK